MSFNAASKVSLHFFRFKMGRVTPRVGASIFEYQQSSVTIFGLSRERRDNIYILTSTLGISIALDGIHMILSFIDIVKGSVKHQLFQWRGTWTEELLELRCILLMK
jgi:hypothetical protein